MIQFDIKKLKFEPHDSTYKSKYKGKAGILYFHPTSTKFKHITGRLQNKKNTITTP